MKILPATDKRRLSDEPTIFIFLQKSLENAQERREESNSQAREIKDIRKKRDAGSPTKYGCFGDQVSIIHKKG